MFMLLYGSGVRQDTKKALGRQWKIREYPLLPQQIMMMVVCVRIVIMADELSGV